MIKKSRKIFFAALGGILISFCYVAGAVLDRFDSLDLKEPGFYGRWLAAAVLVTGILFLLWEGLDRLPGRMSEGRRGSEAWADRKDFWGKLRRLRLPGWACVLFMLLCWLPALLSLFPGAFAYDAYEEWTQVHTGAVTSHHPVLHVLTLGGLVELFYGLTGSYNVGMAVYSVLQMVLLAVVLTAVLRFLEDFGVPGFFRLLALMFFGLSPVMQLFAISATKDVLFTGAELLFFLYCLRFCLRREELLESRSGMAGFCVSAFCTMILRNNGLYIVLGMLAVLAVSCRRDWKRCWRKLAVMLVGILLPYLLYVGPFYSLLRVTQGGVEEMLSVPLQQMARVYRYDYDSLEQEDIELLYSVVNREDLEQYRATVSDFVKRGFNRQGFEENKAEFIKLWVRWGVSHPLTYINSFLVNTVDAWYPGAVVDGYRHGDGRSSYFDYQVDKPGTEVVLLPKLHDFYEHLSHDDEAQKAPLAFLVLSPGWYLVLALVIFLYFWRSRLYGMLLPGMLLLLHFGTVLLGPMALVRYMLIFYYGFPVFLAMVLFRDRMEGVTGSGQV